VVLWRNFFTSFFVRKENYFVIYFSGLQPYFFFFLEADFPPSGSGSALEPTECGSNEDPDSDPDPKHWFGYSGQIFATSFFVREENYFVREGKISRADQLFTGEYCGR
jgi:hypothetical protein